MAPSAKYFKKFGTNWPVELSEIDVCVYCIQEGGVFVEKGERMGAPLYDLYRELQSLLWPDDDHHRWSDLMLKTIVENRITVVQGPSDSSKTRTMAKFGLTDYFCFPNESLILVSSTDVRGLELRVWGDIKSLWQRAMDVWPKTPGVPVDSLHGIFTDKIGGDDPDAVPIRDMRKGLICIPCLESGGAWKGLEKYTGIKQKRRRLLGDEVQFMQAPYLSTLSNLNKNDFKGVFVGNPIGENDPLDKLAEPQDGWDSLGDIPTTTTWKNKMGGVTIQLVGMDSPGITDPDKYPYLKSESDLNRVRNYWGEDSAEWWNQAAGVRRPGVSARRVITRDMVNQFNARDSVIWRGSDASIKGYALDAAYGGDRCVGISFEFGTDINMTQVLSFMSVSVVPVKVYPKGVPEEERVIAEDQIALFVKDQCERLGIPPGNVYFDSTGRGSLGTSFSRLWSSAVNPIEFGGAPTPRPVCSDLFIFDEKTRQRRLKRADEHYSKKVSELHFSLRYAMEGRQIRNIPEEVVDELCAREWGMVKGNKIEVESKDDTKERLGRSPDRGDAAVIAVEGARRLGFRIARLESEEAEEEDKQWQRDFADRAARFKKSYALTY